MCMKYFLYKVTEKKDRKWEVILYKVCSVSLTKSPSHCIFVSDFLCLLRLDSCLGQH